MLHVVGPDSPGLPDPDYVDPMTQPCAYCGAEANEGCAPDCLGPFTDWAPDED